MAAIGSRSSRSGCAACPTRRSRAPAAASSRRCNATRTASAAELIAAAKARALRLMSEGVTTIEVKSGYGLDFDTEKRMLEAARSLARELAGVDQHHVSRAACACRRSFAGGAPSYVAR